jgi:Zn-dependent M28 family amino/carboxypeptidase
MRRLLIAAAAMTAVLGVASSVPVAADPPLNQKALARLSSIANIRFHQQQLQNIADANGDTRAAGTAGYDKSADYVAKVLKRAGLKVTRQEFPFPFFQETGTPEFERISPTPATFIAGTDFLTMQFSAAGEVTGQVQEVDVTFPPTPEPSSTSGCDAADFAGFTPGNIALIQRGFCFFSDKVANAELAGASAVIMFNEGQPGRTDAFDGTLGAPVGIPVIFATFAIGEQFHNLIGSNPPVTARIEVFAFSEERTTVNVFGETRFGSKNHVVVVGAHLDSVLAGPGINDNGSGTAVILDIAQKHRTLFPRNKLRFAFWGAEESGLIGSTFYVDNLTPEERAQIMLNLNFDMMGSPNFVRFVYDGDGSIDPTDPDLAGPPGSDKIEEVFERFFEFRGLQTEPTAFDGRSDYGPFIAEGIDIPAGGLFSGAEVLKTPEQAAIYGGTAGVAYDPCYHDFCDTVGNVSEEGLKQLAQGAAFSVLWWSFDRLPPRAPAAMVALQSGRSARSASSAPEYKGPFLQK